MKFYLGIDESNNGRTPEFVVGVASTFEEDVFGNSIDKRRGNRNIPSLLVARDFLYTIIEKKHKEDYNVSRLKIISYSQLIMGFLEEIGELELVIIDGEVNKKTLTGVRNILFENGLDSRVNRIVGIPKGDITYCVVNIADQIANYLLRQHRIYKESREKNEYKEHLIELKA